MAPPTPPPPPPPGYFERRAALIAKAANAAAASLSALTIAPQNYPAPILAAPISLADTISDVSPYIPIVLDLAAHNYYHWRHLFDLHFCRCNLRSHVTANCLPRPDDPQWLKDNLAIVQWFYTRITTEIFNMLDHDGATAANIWHSLRQLFQSNTDARKNALHTELRNMVQGDAPVNLFCQRVKTIGDELRELGDTVSDSQLINIVVVGLSEDFDKQASFIPMIRPPPTFAEVRSLLQLAAETQARKDSRPKVFHAAACPPLSSTPAPPSMPAPAAGPSASSSVQPPRPAS